MNYRKETIFTYEKLYQAYLECRKNKRNTINALDFEIELEDNLHKLLLELKNRKYKPGRSTCFVVKRPKIREIFAADFRDRIVHHLFVSELIPIAEKTLSESSFACRKGKGTHAGVAELKKHLNKLALNNNLKDIHYLQLDISSFFMSIDQNILLRIIYKNIESSKKEMKWQSEMKWLSEIIIYNKVVDNYFAKGELELYHKLPYAKSLFGSVYYKGLPIGNYTSQYFANLYMNELDQFVKRELGAKHYVRYVDDFVILSADLKFLQDLPKQINNFLQKRLGLSLNQNKTKLKNIRSGIDFLGYIIKPDYTLVRNSVAGRFEDKLQYFEGLFKENLALGQKGLNPLESLVRKLQQTTASYFGHFGHANSYFLDGSLSKGFAI
jgi:hypothetical protein